LIADLDGIIGDLHNADDAVIDIYAELGHRNRLDIANDLLCGFAWVGQYVDFGWSSVRTGYHACRAYAWDRT